MKQISQNKKKEIVKRFQNGETVNSLVESTKISRSTLYSWIKKYAVSKSVSGIERTLDDYHKLQSHIAKLENIVRIIKSAQCSYHDPLRDKLYVLEDLYGNSEYSVRELCEALDVDRSTFYNHIKRSKKENTVHARRKEQMKILIREVYDDNNQIFGAQKIEAILKARGIKIDEEYITKLMQEMEIKSMCIGSKSIHKKSLKRKSVIYYNVTLL